MKTDKLALNWARFAETPRYYFSVCEDGTVEKTNKRDFSPAPVKRHYRTDGRVMIWAGRTPYQLDSIVARMFLPNYFKGCVVKHLDGNQKNCSVWNLCCIPRGNGGGGWRKPCEIDGVEYESYSAAARALFYSRSTISKRINRLEKTNVRNQM